ncbi:GNAT family protein [Clostridium sp.]|uniref:GNAT family N-acetyltransferase n=1 Tax=Clostridium sp. TaxID=1506 RepID=UPI002FC8A180
MICGKKVIIRQLELGDEAYLYRWWNDENLMAHAGLAFGTLQSKESIRLNILKEIESSALFPEKKRFIICKKEDMTPIGEMNYISWDIRNQKCMLGIKICEIPEQGKGYGEDALIHFIDFLFKFLNLNKIELDTMVDNKRSRSIYKKLGFKEIGIIRQGYFDSRNGKFQDVMYMDLLKCDWRRKEE